MVQPVRLTLANLANRLIRLLARSRHAARAAALMRNQCNALIGYHLASTPHLEDNGEGWLLDQVASQVARFVDVGANQGEWSLALLERAQAAEGIAVDAGAAAVQRLRRVSNGRLAVVHAAVSEKVGETTFFEEPNAGEWSSLSPTAARNAMPRQVVVTTIDRLLEDAGWDRVDLVKIDTEGWDLHCLRGAVRAIAEQRVAMIQFEYNAPWVSAGSTLKAAIDYLASYGYEVRVLRPRGAEAFEYECHGEYFRYSNFVAFAPAAADWLPSV
jgi:FkbM family methyltransferase